MQQKLSILYICPDDSLGGSSRSLLDLIRSTRAEVAPVVLFAKKGLAYEEFKKNGIESIVHPYIRLHQVSTWENVIIHPWRSLLVHVFTYDVACVRYIKKYFKGRKIDIVHSNFSPTYIGVWLSKVLHAKHVWHVREFIDLDFHYKVYGGLKLLRWFVNKADARVAITTAIRNHWQMPIENTWVILNAIRSQKDMCYMPQKEKYVLYSAFYLSDLKGARVAIEAFARSGVATNGFTLMMMGNCDDEYRQSLIDTARKHSVENAIKFIGCQSNVKPYFIKASAYVMSSEFEALGRVTGEAMFYGCPVVAHATGGTLDLIKHGVTGYLYDTIDECAVYVKKVCATNQEKIILQAQEFAFNNLSQEVYGPKIMEVYKKVLTDQYE